MISKDIEARSRDDMLGLLSLLSFIVGFGLLFFRYTELVGLVLLILSLLIDIGTAVKSRVGRLGNDNSISGKKS